MIQHREEVIMPYKPRQMYDLVLDIEKYPEFLPWCQDLRILKHEDNKLEAELTIGYKFFREKFQCKVYFIAPKDIKAHYISGPLKSLTNEWAFSSAGRNKTRIKFCIQFEFKGALFQKLADALFNKVFQHMVRAFEKRAAEIYG